MSEWETFGDDAGAKSNLGRRCGVAIMLEQCIPAEHRDAVRRHIEDPAYQTNSVARALRDRLGDKAPGRQSVGNHRRGVCRCKPLEPAS